MVLSASPPRLSCGPFGMCWHLAYDSRRCFNVTFSFMFSTWFLSLSLPRETIMSHIKHVCVTATWMWAISVISSLQGKYWFSRVFFFSFLIPRETSEMCSKNTVVWLVSPFWNEKKMTALIFKNPNKTKTRHRYCVHCSWDGRDAGRQDTFLWRDDFGSFHLAQAIHSKCPVLLPDLCDSKVSWNLDFY